MVTWQVTQQLCRNHDDVDCLTQSRGKTRLQSSMAAAACARSRRSSDTPQATLWPFSQLWLMDSVSSRFSTVWCHPLRRQVG